LLGWSAKTDTALEAMTANLAGHLERHPDADLADVAYTLHVGRRGFGRRRVLVCQSREDALVGLRSDRCRSAACPEGQRSVVFVFPGPGAPHVNMGRGLYKGEPAFRDAVDRCGERLRPHLGIDLREALYPAAGEAGAAGMEQPPVARAARFAVGYALAELWRAWGVQPQSLIGLGLGEYVAACLAGVFSLEEALALVVTHGQPVLQRLKNATLRPPRIPFVSNVTGTWITAEQATSADYWARTYWARNRADTTQLADPVRAFVQGPARLLLEMGPGCSLAPFHRPGGTPGGPVVLSSIKPPRESQPDQAFLLDALGRLWLAGGSVSWAEFYAGQRRRRVPLPTYPFQRQRCWVEPKGPTEGSPADSARLGKQADLSRWFYTPSWRQAPPPAPDNRTSLRPTWLLFLDECGVGDRLAQQLEQQGQDVVRVTGDGGFCRLARGAYQLRPDAPADYLALTQALAADGQLPGQIVHLWSVTPDGHADQAGCQALQARGFYSLLHLAQALGRQAPEAALRLWLVSNHLHDVTGQEEVCPAKATILGPWKVLPKEYPNLACGCVDVALTPAGPDPRLVSQLLAEFAGEPEAVPVAYRGAHRWVLGYEPVRLAPAAPAAAGLRPRGTYLITGGLGGIGLALADHLARLVKARLVLVSRTPLPERSAWPDWLRTHDERDETGRKIRKVQDLERAGAEVLVLPADVADLGQMQGAVARAAEAFGPIHGVIHAAGLARGRLVQDKTAGMAAQVLAPKVAGSLVLAQVFRDAPLDFFASCSSLASILGERGHVDYCAANAFLDAFTQAPPAGLRTRMLALNWDVWHEVGMVAEYLNRVREAGGRPVEEATPPQGIRPPEGADAFCRALASPLTRVLVSPVDFQARLEQHRSSPQGKVAPKEPAPRPDPKASAPAAPGTGFVAHRDELERQLVAIWEEVLGRSPIGIRDDYFTVGGDSLRAVPLMSKIAPFFKERPPLAVLFQASTVEKLANLIRREGGSAREVLEPVQAKGSRCPFFCVPPGLAYSLLALARNLGEEQPFYTFRPLGLDGGPPQTRVEEMAALYVDALRRRQPEGPYLLGGYSEAGIVAFEMARQLQAQGREVALLALLDGDSPLFFDERRLQDYDEIFNVERSVLFKAAGLSEADAEAWRAQGPTYELADKLTEFAVSNGYLPASISAEEVLRLYTVKKVHHQAYRNYRPPASPVRIDFFRAGSVRGHDAQAGWRSFASEIVVHVAPGNHYTMMQEPHVQRLAERLQACIRQALEGGLARRSA
jgi:thioesterase domain-containing protein/NADP-dependent 3-hydroxy acid dehydrogenase YdfG